MRLASCARFYGRHIVALCENPAAWGVTSGDITINTCDEHISDALRYLGVTAMCYAIRSQRPQACCISRHPIQIKVKGS